MLFFCEKEREKLFYGWAKFFKTKNVKTTKSRLLNITYFTVQNMIARARPS